MAKGAAGWLAARVIKEERGSVTVISFRFLWPRRFPRRIGPIITVASGKSPIGSLSGGLDWIGSVSLPPSPLLIFLVSDRDLNFSSLSIDRANENIRPVSRS